MTQIYWMATRPRSGKEKASSHTHRQSALFIENQMSERASMLDYHQCAAVSISCGDHVGAAPMDEAPSGCTSPAHPCLTFSIIIEFLESRGGEHMQVAWC